MISISENMDGYDIAQQIRMERQVHKGSFLLLEGDTDIRRFERFMDEGESSAVNCFGRSNVIAAIELLYDEAFPGALGLVDADFDRIFGSVVAHEGIVYSRYHDLDIDWALSAAFERYMKEVADRAKCDAIGGYRAVIEIVLSLLKPVSVLRFLNEAQGLRYNLKNIRVDNTIKDSVIDTSLLLDEVFYGRNVDLRIRNRLEELIESHSKRDVDLLQLTNGHDFFVALGVLLREDFGDRRHPQTWGNEVAIHFRLTFEERDLRASPLYAEVLEWEAKEAFRIWAPRLH